MYYRYIKQPSDNLERVHNKWFRISRYHWNQCTNLRKFHEEGSIELRKEHHFTSRAYQLQKLWEACHAVTDNNLALRLAIKDQQEKLFPTLPLRMTFEGFIKELTEAIQAEATRKGIWLS